MRSVVFAAVTVLSLSAFTLAASAQARPAHTPPAPAARTPAGPSAADWRTPDPENILVIDTSKGRIIVELEPRMAPAHVERVRTLTRQGFYNGRAFFRVIDGFMDQTGDPLDSGEGGSPLPDLEAEFSQRRSPEFPMSVNDHPAGKDAGFVGVTPVISEPGALAPLMADGRVPVWGDFCPGVLGMARAQAENSANSQFFLMRAAYPSLNRRYTVFGRAISGLPVIRAIKVGEPVAEPRDVMTTVRVLADIPEAERPVIRIVDTRGAWFTAYAAQQQALAGASFNICDLDIPVEMRDAAASRR